jgi:hypothetical protein
MNDNPPRVTPLTGARTDALRRFADAVLDARDGFRNSVKLHTEHAEGLAADPIRAALSRGQAMAFEEAAGQLDDAVGIATGRWGQGRRI